MGTEQEFESRGKAETQGQKYRCLFFFLLLPAAPLGELSTYHPLQGPSCRHNPLPSDAPKIPIQEPPSKDGSPSASYTQSLLRCVFQDIILDGLGVGSPLPYDTDLYATVLCLYGFMASQKAQENRGFFATHTHCLQCKSIPFPALIRTHLGKYWVGPKVHQDLIL